MKWTNLILSMIVMTPLLFNGCLGFDCELIDDFPKFEDIETMGNSRLELLLINNPNVVLGEGYDTSSFVINDDSTYNSWKSIADTTCLACNFPDIDFSTRTLIGKYEELTCSEVPLVKIVQEGNTYTHYIKKVDDTKCVFASCFNYTLAWVTVPKIDDTATIVYESGKSHYKCDDCF